MSEWVKVELAVEDMAEAERIAQLRHRESRDGRFAPNRGTATLANDRIGARGEVAAAKFLGISHPLTGRRSSYGIEQAQGGWDVGGYEVRSADRSSYRLVLRESDRARDPGLKMMLVLTHDYPVVWIAGWITLGDALKSARSGTARGHMLGFVPQNALTSFASGRWLVSPRARFWCEACGGSHPIIEHRLCRAAS